VRDSLELEWAGIPAVAIVHEAFSLAAAATADVSGHARYRWIEVPYPTSPPGEWSDDEIAAVACALAPDVLALLHGD
jgi:hypothetical protein